MRSRWGELSGAPAHSEAGWPLRLYYSCYHSGQHGYCPLTYSPAAGLLSTWWGAFELSDPGLHGSGRLCQLESRRLGTCPALAESVPGETQVPAGSPSAGSAKARAKM